MFPRAPSIAGYGFVLFLRQCGSAGRLFITFPLSRSTYLNRWTNMDSARPTGVSKAASARHDLGIRSACDLVLLPGPSSVQRRRTILRRNDRVRRLESTEVTIRKQRGIV